MPYTLRLAGDGSRFPPSARGARVSGPGPSRYASGCTTSASVEAGLRASVETGPAQLPEPMGTAGGPPQPKSSVMNSGLVGAAGAFNDLADRGTQRFDVGFSRGGAEGEAEGAAG